MPDEKRETPPDQEVQEILGDLDAILSDLGGAPAASLAPKPPPSAAPPSPAAKPPAPVPAPPPKPAAPPPSAPSAAPSGEVSIELGARSLPAAKPPEKKPEPASPKLSLTKPPLELDLGGPAAPAPAPAAKPPAPAVSEVPQVPAGRTSLPPAPAPAAPPAPAPQPAVPAPRGFPPAAALPEIPAPDKIGKDQVRRVAFLYLGKFEAERDALAKLLDQTAQTVPKKPLFLRRVLYQPVNEDCGGKELLARVQQAKAVAVLGIVEGISEPKLREWSEALSGAGVMFRAVAPLEAGKKSVAIDIVVDAMLLAHEAA